jgi:hypothetical protein
VKTHSQFEVNNNNNNNNRARLILVAGFSEEKRVIQTARDHPSIFHWSSSVRLILPSPYPARNSRMREEVVVA